MLDFNKYLLDYARNFKQFKNCLEFGLLNKKFNDRFSIFEPQKHKWKSNTLFILATGTTINEICDANWDHVNQHDSIGINLFSCHDYKPDILMFEHVTEHNAYLFFLDSLINFAKINVTSILITSFHSYILMLFNFSKYEKLLKILNECFAKNFSLYNIQFARHYYSQTLWLSHFINKLFLKNHLLHVRGSVSIAINIGIKAQFRSIVLCGVDLDNKGHFYDTKGSIDTLHKTAQRINSNINLKDYIKYVASNNKDIQFYVSSKQSNLSSILPVYPWN